MAEPPRVAPGDLQGTCAGSAARGAFLFRSAPQHRERSLVGLALTDIPSARGCTQMLSERRKADGDALNRSIAVLYKTRQIDDPDERAAMLSTGARQAPSAFLLPLGPSWPALVTAVLTRWRLCIAQRRRTSMRRTASTLCSARILTNSPTGGGGSGSGACSASPRAGALCTERRGEAALVVLKWR